MPQLTQPGGTPPKSRTMRRRRWLGVAAGFVAVAASVVFAAPLALEAGARFALRRAGFSEVAGRIARLSIDQARIEGVKIGGLEVGSATVSYSLPGLFAGRVQSVDISAVQVALTRDSEGGLALAGAPPDAPADAEPKAGASFRWIDLPFDRLTVRDAVVIAPSDFGPVRVAVDGLTLESGGAGATATFDAAAEIEDLPGARLAARGRVEATPELIALWLDGCAALAAPSVAWDAGRIGSGSLCLKGREDKPAASLRLRDGALELVEATLVASDGEAHGAAADGPVEARLAEATLDAAYRPGEILRLDATASGAALRGPWGEVVLERGEIVVAPASHDGAATARFVAEGVAKVAAGLGDAAPGEARFELAAEGEAGQGEATGNVRVAVAAPFWPGIGEGVSLRVAARVAGDGQGLRAETERPWLLTLRPDAAWSGLFPDAGARVALVVEDGALAYDSATEALSVDGWVALDGDARRLLSATAEDLRIRVADGAILSGAAAAALPRMRVGELELAVDRALAEFVDGNGRFRLDAQADGTVAEDWALEGGRVVADGRLAWDGAELALVPDGCAALSAERFARDGVALRDLSACAAAEADAPLLVLNGAEARANGSLSDMALSGRLGDESFAANGRVEAFAVRIADGDAEIAARARFDARLPGRRLAIEGGSAELVWKSAAKPQLGLDFAGVVASTDAPRLFAPLTAVGATTGDGVGVRFEASLTEAASGARVDLSGSHDAESGQGRLTAALRPLVFAPSGVSPGAILPPLAPHVTTASGAASGDVAVVWGGRGGARASGRLKLDDVDLATAYGDFVGVVADIDLASLAPLRSDGPQIATIRLANLGLPLANAQANFAVDDGLRVFGLSAELAGGTVAAEPFAIVFGAETQRLTLYADGVDVERLLESAAVEGLTATGVLDGRLPLEYGPDGLRFDDAFLAARGGGVIRYAASAAPNWMATTSGADLLLQALANFHYETLRVTLSGRTGGELTAALKIKGANPDLYDGYPISLNLNVSGALDAILRRGLSAYRLPDEVGRRIEELTEGR